MSAAAAAASMRFLSCFTCHPVLVSLPLPASSRWSLLRGGVGVPITPKRRCHRPLRRSNSDASTRVTKAATGGDTERERDLRAAQGVLHEGFMLYAEVLIEFVLHKWLARTTCAHVAHSQNGSDHDREREREREEPFA